MSDNIPFEIQIEIMRSLPTKSLIQFRSVSKSWKSLIDSPEFITDYHNHQHDHHRLLVRYDDNFDELKYISILDNDNDNDSNFPQNKFPITIPESVKRINKPELVGCSHGLFCFYNFYNNDNNQSVVSNKVVVWNPSIRKSVDIDVCHILSWPYETVIGFWVCPHTLHYKLLKVSFIRPELQIDNINDIPHQVEVFSGGVWRSPLCVNNLPRKSIAFAYDQIELDGVLYWHCYDRSPFGLGETGELMFDYRELIIAFDITSEEFTEIHFPDGLAQYCSPDFFVAKIKESLVVVKRYAFEKRNYGVWKMEEHGISKIFIMLYNISLPEASVGRVLGFRKSGEPIVRVCFDSEQNAEQNEMVVYEPDTKRMNKVGIYGKSGTLFASSYVETLLLSDL